MPRGANRYDEAARQGRLWTPALLRGSALLKAWYDAADLNTISYGTGVSAWADKSGFGHTLAQATGGNQPPINYTQFSRPSLQFTGTSVTLTNSTLVVAQPFSSFVVWKATSSSNTGLIWANAATTVWVEPYRPSIGNKAAMNAGSIVFDSTGPTVTVGNKYIWGSAFNAGSSASSFNGSYNTLGSSVGTGGITAGILVSLPTTDIIAGYLAELVFISTTNLREFRLMEGYLAWKWDMIDLLSGTHPFKNRPPVIGD